MSNLVSGGKLWRLQFGMFGGDSGSGEREREREAQTHVQVQRELFSVGAAGRGMCAQG